MKEGIYRDLLIETIYEDGKKRGRPLDGQGLSCNLRVECSRNIRNAYPLGTVFLLHVKITRVHGTPFLYTHYTWHHKVMSPDEVEEFMDSFTPLEDF